MHITYSSLLAALSPHFHVFGLCLLIELCDLLAQVVAESKGWENFVTNKHKIEEFLST